MSFLDRAVEQKQRQLSSLISKGKLTCASRAPRLIDALSPETIDIIAEIKPRSPSQGQIRPISDLDRHIEAYDRHASAISVLTDSNFFGGSFELLGRVRSKTELPLLAKDFFIHEKQLQAASRFGAQAALLIVKILEPARLNRLMAECRKLDLEPVVEVGTSDELQTALSMSPDLILINNRNLATMEIDLNTTASLANELSSLHSSGNIGGQPVIVAASGIESRSDITSLLKSTTNFLIGTSLMKSDEPDRRLIELKRPPRHRQEAKNEKVS